MGEKSIEMEKREKEKRKRFLYYIINIILFGKNLANSELFLKIT